MAAQEVHLSDVLPALPASVRAQLRDDLTMAVASRQHGPAISTWRAAWELSCRWVQVARLQGLTYDDLRATGSLTNMALDACWAHHRADAEHQAELERVRDENAVIRDVDGNEVLG